MFVEGARGDKQLCLPYNNEQEPWLKHLALYETTNLYLMVKFSSYLFEMQ